MYILSFYLITRHIIKKISCTCDEETPFNRNNTCSETPCSDSESDNECFIDNDLIKDQWITNLIKIGPENYTTIDILKTDKNELIVLSSTVPEDGRIIFYGLNSKGNYYYSNQIKNITFPYERKKAFNTLVNLANKQYILSVAIGNEKTEIINYENTSLVVNDSIYALYHLNISSYRSTLFELLPDENGTIYFLFSYITSPKKGSDKKNITYRKISLFLSGNKLKIENKGKITNYTKDVEMTSCIQAKNGYIVCFYVSNDSLLYLIEMNDNFTLYNLTEINNVTGFENSFHKCIKFKDNIGVFSNFELNNENEISLFTRLITIQDDGNLTTTINNKDKIIGPFEDYNYNFRLNDLAQINDWRFCICSTNQNKSKIYLTCYTVEENYSDIYLASFSINIKQLYNFYIFQDIRIQQFNNFIVLGFSYCNDNSSSSLNDDLYYSGLTFLSYLNSTDIYYDVVYFFCENNFLYDNITFNLWEHIKIENNIFGYKIDSIKITRILDYTIFSVTSYVNGNNITENDELDNKTSLIKVDFIGKNYTNAYNVLEYVGIARPREFNYSKEYINSSEQTDEKYVEKEQNNTYYGRTGYLTFGFRNIKKDFSCINPKINIIFKDTNEYIIGYNNGNIKKDIYVNVTKEKIKNTEEDEEEEESMPEEDNTQCTVTQILDNKCKSNDIGDSQILGVYENLKTRISEWDYTSDDNTIIETKNVIFQISSYDDQKNTSLNISYVNLGECENILKMIYGIDSQQSLLIFKIDIISDDTNSRYVQYEIYNPNNNQRLDLSICKNKIEINIPASLDSKTESLYDNLKNQGYNLFDSEDDFYNDICTPYTSENDTDLTIAYRQNNLYKSLCQDGCVFNEYNKNNERISCNCEAQTNSTKTSLSNIKFYSSFLFSSFYSNIKISNFLVMKCYKLFFNFKDFFKNVGKIFMVILHITFIVIMVLCIIKKDKQLLDFMMTILNYKFHIYNPNYNSKKEQLNENNEISHLIKKNLKKTKIKKGKKKTGNGGKKSTNHKKEHNHNPPIKKNYEDTKKLKIERRSMHANFNIITLPTGLRRDIISSENSKFALNKSAKNLNQLKVYKKEELTNKPNSSKNKRKKNPQKIIQKQKQLNNYEFNYLTYKEALIIDNRTFMIFYWTLLKQKQLLLFAVFPEKDYNLRFMKILIFILSFSLYFTINAFFFVDDTMDKINLYSGKFNFLFHLPQIIYSSLITTILNIVIKNLALSMKNILLLKKSKNLEEAKEQCKEIEKELNTKFIIFFILGNVLMVFYCYFIACFCSVYKNTQLILIKDTLISFAISMLYPFGTCLIPAVFRLASLTDKNKKRECLYNLSTVITFFL